MVRLYTNHCRKCEILTAKLNEKNVEYEVIDDEELLRSCGYDLMPVLEIDGRQLDYGDAIKYVNAL